MLDETLAIVSFILGGMAVLFCAHFGKKYLFALSTFIIVATNATVGIQVELFGFSVSWGVILYSLIYIITDILSEFDEKNSAYQLAITNVAIQIIFWSYIFLTLPLKNVQTGETFNALSQLYSVTPRITIAAIIASLGAFVDVWIYQKIREWAIKRESSLGSLVIRNNISTFIGQTVNTVLFFGIALYGVVPNIVDIILGAVFFKWIIALLDTGIILLASLVYKNKEINS